MKNLTFDELREGMEGSFTKKITSKDIITFSEITGDKNPLHLNKKFAQSTIFKKPIVFGMLINSLLSTLAGMHIPGRNSLIISVESCFKLPCFENDVLKIKGVLNRKLNPQKIIILKTEITNQNLEIIQTGKMFIKLLI
ncbi:MAG: MaoC family dehydratase [Nanoarchaeota archaeon]|nr:MaoC family dehydratase [Nanoarchaeota archaeon]